MTERFDDEELERYARQIVLREVGGIGQERLRAARLAVVGAGGLGCPAALYLATAGIGALTLIDDDRVALTNLHRQVLFEAGDLGAAKVEVAARALHARTPRLDVRPLRTRLTPANAQALLAGHDLVLDGSDSFATRKTVAEAAAGLRIPLLSGAVQGFEGQLALFMPFAQPTSPCFRCLFPDDPDAAALPTCAVGGVLGPMAGQVGTLMAIEAIKHLLGIGAALEGKLLLVDGLDARIDRLGLGRRRGCGAGWPCARTEPAPSTPSGDSALASEAPPR